MKSELSKILRLTNEMKIFGTSNPQSKILDPK